jgi:hypothetical protein
MLQIQTRHEWVAELAAQSGCIAAMRLDKQIRNADLDVDAIKLAHDEAHARVIIRAVEALLTSHASTQQNTAALLTDIICRDAYGKFSELAAYDWLMRNNLKITTQVRLYAEDILGSRDTILDGVIDFCGIYFEIKAFGFHGHLAKRLKERLEPYFIGKRVFIEASWDLSVDLFTQVIRDVPKIAVELRQNLSKQIGPLRIRIQAPQPMTMTRRRVQPYLLARENALYPFRSANQFTNKAPFIVRCLDLNPRLQTGRGLSRFLFID